MRLTIKHFTAVNRCWVTLTTKKDYTEKVVVACPKNK